MGHRRLKVPESLRVAAEHGVALGCGEIRSNGQVAGIDQDVVRKPELLEKRDAAAERLADEESIVGFALRDVPDTDQLRMRGERLELRARVRRLQIDPADDAGDERVR